MVPHMDPQAITGLLLFTGTSLVTYLLHPDTFMALLQTEGAHLLMVTIDPLSDTEVQPMSRRGAGAQRGTRAPGRGPSAAQLAEGIVGMALVASVTPMGKLGFLAPP